MLKGKTVILGVTGSIAAYKAAYVASGLKKQHCDVNVMLTRNAVNFINPITFESLTGNKCLVDSFDRDFKFEVTHISLAKRADLLLIAPASADIIAKLAHGIADDMLTTTALACDCTKIVAPAMNTQMYLNPIVQENIGILRRHGFIIVEPAAGYLACGDMGIGKMPEPDVLLNYAYQEIACEKDMLDLNVLVTAGPTREAIDPVRFITNHSTGKMGYALAENAARRGAKVTLVTGPVDLEIPLFVDAVKVSSAQEMFEEVTKRQSEQDIIIKAAAVADYRPIHCAEEKIKKTDSESVLQLERTEDILKYLGEHKKEGQFICGFSMETCNVIENSRKKLEKKQADMIVANSLRTEGAGFGTDTNIVTLITKETEIELPKMSKREAADEIYNKILMMTAYR